MSKIDDLLREAEAEKGYIEKSRAAYDKYGAACLYPKKQYAGKDNLTKFALEAGHKNGEPWCQTFVAALLIRVFGRETADKLLCGKIRSASTMEVKDAMVKAGRSVPIAEAKPGDLAYRSRSGGGHVGIITGWRNGGLVTVEGNTSGSDVNSWNGGEVAEHTGATGCGSCARTTRSRTGTGWKSAASGTTRTRPGGTAMAGNSSRRRRARSGTGTFLTTSARCRPACRRSTAFYII